MNVRQGYTLILIFLLGGYANADMLAFEGFESPGGFSATGNAGYWGIAPLGGTATYPSGFATGGSQSGDIFYGVWGYDSTAEMMIALGDLSGYTELTLTVALAAPGGTTWENTHRDSLFIRSNLGTIDSILPTDRGSPLRSDVWGVDLTPTFADFSYDLASGVSSLTFAFASTAGNEVIGIDSVAITGTVVPAPAALLLGALGLGTAGWRLRRGH